MQSERGRLSLDNIFIALDFPTWKETKYFIEENDFYGIPVKVGMELFYREGPNLIYALKENNHPIFLDLKLHDIPNTVYHSMKNLSSLEVDIVNVHGVGGIEMISKAKDGLLAGTSAKNGTKLIAVTVLTSFTETSFQQTLLVEQNLKDYALHLAKLSQLGGADGVVCSAHEAKYVKKLCGKDFLTVTPGIRVATNEKDDQQRVATPSWARKNGSDILTIGRPITKADNPKKAYNDFLKEWKSRNE